MKFIKSKFAWFALGLTVFALIAADVTTTMFDTTYFSATDTKVSLVGTLTNWAKLTTNSAGGSGSAMVGTVSNNVASAGLLAVDSTKTNGIAATLAHMTNAFGLDGVTTKFISGDGTERTPATVSAANPTATVSGSAVNGSASTFMRSDAAPALSTVGTAGTYRSVTTDANGRVTAGTAPTTFSGYGISDTGANFFNAISSGKQGTGVPVFDTSPSLTTPSLGVASATSLTMGGTNVIGELAGKQASGSYLTAPVANGSLANSSITINGTTVSLGGSLTLNCAQAPIDAEYLILGSNSTLTGYRSLTAGAGISVTDGGATAALTIAATNVPNANLQNSSVTINGNAVSLGGSKTLSLASSDFANQGTTTTILHGNGAGNPSFSAVSLANDITGTLGIGSGGTGQTTAAPAFDALAPTSAQGDIIYRGASANARLAAGTSGQFLQTAGAGANPTWASPPWSMQVGCATTGNPTTNTTYFIGNNSTIIVYTSSGNGRVYIPKTGTLTAVYWYFVNTGVAGTTENHWALSFRLNNSTDTALNSSFDLSSSVAGSATGLSTAVTAGDYFEFKLVAPVGLTTVPTAIRFQASLAFQSP